VCRFGGTKGSSYLWGKPDINELIAAPSSLPGFHHHLVVDHRSDHIVHDLTNADYVNAFAAHLKFEEASGGHSCFDPDCLPRRRADPVAGAAVAGGGAGAADHPGHGDVIGVVLLLKYLAGFEGRVSDQALRRSSVGFMAFPPEIDPLERFWLRLVRSPSVPTAPRHSSVALMAFSPKIDPPDRFCLSAGSKSRAISKA
jgi:hypothetical protein